MPEPLVPERKRSVVRVVDMSVREDLTISKRRKVVTS
jgi:hypothetical protein